LITVNLVDMCKKLWNLLFPKPDPIPEPEVPPVNPMPKKTALLFTIGIYPNIQNNLAGPPIDADNVDYFMAGRYPEFALFRFANSMVTRSTFAGAIKDRISKLKVGDILLIYYSGHGTNGYDSSEPDKYKEGIYLYDGTFWDDEFTLLLQDIPTGAKVIIVLDSCFAHGSTTPKSLTYRKEKFVKTEEMPPKGLKAILKSDVMNYIVFAACGEDQTSSDTDKGGVFTLYWLKSWLKDMSYQQWSDRTALAIEKTNFDQNPNIEGDINLINETVFT
jgi:hypothetical protein